MPNTIKLHRVLRASPEIVYRAFLDADAKPMKKYLPCIAGVLLGLCFLAASIPVLFNLIKIPAMPEGTPAANFMAAFVPTGYVKFVKMFEFTGGILVMIPRLRNLGLLLLGPVIVNIIAFHVLIDDPKHLLNPMLDIIIVCALYLLWDARKKFSGLLN
jgi:putative oxidoreductase